MPQQELPTAPRREQADWLKEFQRLHGRPLRVLHIGNIANNAYLNSTLLIDQGVDCHVMCHDYYHIMGCPEWEDAELEGEVEDHFRPDWTKVNLGGFERPRWFAQGPLELAALYLVARCDGRCGMSWLFWHMMGSYSKVPHFRGGKPRFAEVMADYFWRLIAFAWRLIYFVARRGVVRAYAPRRGPLWTVDAPWWWKVRMVAGFIFGRTLEAVLSPLWFFALLLERGVTTLACGGRPAWDPRWLVQWAKSTWSSAVAVLTRGQGDPFWRAMRTRPEQLVAQFAEKFPDRADQLTTADAVPNLGLMPRVVELLSRYDIVQAYATDPVWPMIADHHPYLAFEHGTLRTFTLEANTTCRLTALAYRLADRVFITNGDCLAYAEKLEITDYEPMLHPVREDRIRSTLGDYKELHAELGVRHVFLCPLRHDWGIKGTDKYLRALPGIVARIGDDFRLILTEWGAQVDESKALAKELGVEHLLIWRQPLARRKLFSMLQSIDVLFDQTLLPVFGATAPEGIAAGVPVIMSYDPAQTAWIVDHPAPILAARTPEEIVEQVVVALDPTWRADYERRAAEWIDIDHTSRRVISTHLEAYREVLEKFAELDRSGSASGMALVAGLPEGG